jgi:hypothetical protein
MAGKCWLLTAALEAIAEMPTKQSDPELLAKQFKANPTLEGFLRLRAENPDQEFDVSLLGGIDHAFALGSLLEAFGIPPQLYAQTLDASEFAIAQMSLLIMQDMQAEVLLKLEGRTHLAARQTVMPQHLRDWLTCCMLGALSRTDDRTVGTDLLALLHFRLMPGASRIEAMAEQHEKKIRASFVAGSLKARGLTPSFRKVAAAMGVQPSTVKRWFASEAEFRAEGDRLALLFEPDGQLKDLFKRHDLLRKE